MDTANIVILSALWLGVLTSISPCPLAGNIVAISFISKELKSSKSMLLSGLFYVIGRILVYTILGILIVASIVKLRTTAVVLQEYINLFLGPLLILIGLFVLKIFKFSFNSFSPGEKLQSKIKGYGVWGSLLLGIILALSFCPISAGLFFGSLIPLASQNDSSMMLPAAFGFGTGLPVVVCAVVLSFSTQYIGKLFDKLTTFEKWASKITGLIFVLGGIYYTLIYIFNINLY